MKSSLTAFAFLVVLALAAPRVFGAELFFRSSDQRDIGLYLNTEGEDINALKVDIRYPRELFVLKEWHDGNSIINLWIEKPAAREGVISFEGLIPGGYSGDEGLVLVLRFGAVQEGSEELIVLSSSAAFLNDGQGTRADLSSSPFPLAVSGKDDIRELQTPEDDAPPELFAPQVVQDPNVFDGKWFLVFATQDKGSGINRYELREKPQALYGFTRWRPAESPYVLRDQSLKSIIEVRAVDNAGNARTVTLEPKHPEPLLARYSILLALVALGTIFFVWRRYLKKR